MIVTTNIPEKFEALFRPKRTKVIFGGRGGAKTESFIRALLVMAQSKGIKVLCLREFMNSMADSVHAAIESIILSDGFQGFNVFNSIITGPKETEFSYFQLSRNINSLKSKFGYDIAWVEEAETVSPESLEKLEPTIRKEGSEIWYSFNPEREDAAVYQEYVLPHIKDILRDGFYEDDDLYVAKVGLDDNQYASTELRRMSSNMKRDDYDKWLHVYGGFPRKDLDFVVIQPKWVEAAIDAHKKLGFEAVGVKSLGFDPADTGADAKALVGRHGSVITSAKAWTSGDIGDAINIVFDKAFHERWEHIVYDSDGLGRAMKVGLDERTEGKSIVVTPYGGNDKKDHENDYYAEDRTNKDTFRNKRAQYWWYLRDRFQATYNAVEKGQYPDIDKLISLSSDLEDLETLQYELSRPQRVIRNNSFIQIESKEEMRKRGVASPNVADALVMCFANPATSGNDACFDIDFGSEW